MSSCACLSTPNKLMKQMKNGLVLCMPMLSWLLVRRLKSLQVVFEVFGRQLRED